MEQRHTMQEIIGKYSSGKIVAVLLFLLLMTGAALIRFHELDKTGFWSDELYHVIAAQGVVQNDRPSFPSGFEYRRAFFFTYLVSESFRLFGVSETTARLPSVVFNILFLLAGFFVVKRWFDVKTACMFLFVMSFSPYILKLTRQCRMYTAFQLFYFLGVYFFWEGFERSGRAHSVRILEKFEKRYGFSIFYLALSVIMFGISYHFHPLTITYSVALTFYVFTVFLVGQKDVPIMDKIKSKYGIVSMIIIGVSLAILIINPEVLEALFDEARALPGWKEGERIDLKLFFWILRVESPIFFFLYPASALYIMRKDLKKGLYIVSNFVVPLLLHTFLFNWKEERFMMYFFPFYIISIVVLVTEILKNVWEQTKQFTLKVEIFNKLVPVCVVFSMFIFAYPWFFNSRDASRLIFWVDWKPTLTKVSPLVKQDAKVITLLDDQSVIYYYLNKIPDYYITPKTYYQDEDAEYKYFNSTPMRTVKDIESVVEKNNDIWIIARKDEYMNAQRYFRKDLMEFIDKNFTAVDSINDRNLIIYKKSG